MIYVGAIIAALVLWLSFDGHALDVAQAEIDQSIAYRQGLAEGARQASAKCGTREYLGGK